MIRPVQMLTRTAMFRDIAQDVQTVIGLKSGGLSQAFARGVIVQYLGYDR